MLRFPPVTAFTPNPALAGPARPYPHAAVLSRAEGDRAHAMIGRWPGHAPTPLVSLPALARESGVAEIRYKQEAGRFGLGSFKALGGAYAVARLLQRRVAGATGREPAVEELLDGRHAALLRDVTVCCATDGNHGRSVAWGARMFGCACTIFVHATVSAARAEAIAALGARVIRTAGNYDDSVREAARMAAGQGWFVVSDTSWPGYAEVPRDVMQGYSVMAEETIGALPAPPTHLFLQGGVGGLAAAVAASFWEAHGPARPVTVVVEPETADCLRRSAAEGRPVTVEGELETIMAGLACGEPSMIAWPILRDAAAAFLAIPDDAAAEAMRLLASGAAGAALVAGESGVAGLAGFLSLSAEQRAALGIGPDSRILCFGSEGATDPDAYRAIVGRPAGEIAP